MTEIWFCNISDFTEEDFEQLLNKFNVSEQQEMLRFRFIKDRLFRLIGRWMVYQKTQQSLGSIQLSESGKPFLPSGKHFNISHSGNVVAVAFSDEEVGVDIEENAQIGFQELIHQFHPEEQQFFHTESSSGNTTSFYTIWTRKEAFLKAIGLGIIEGLNLHNCLDESLEFKGEHWYIDSFNQVEGYSMALCRKNDLPENIHFRELTKSEIFKHETHFA